MSAYNPSSSSSWSWLSMIADSVLALSPVPVHCFSSPSSKFCWKGRPTLSLSVCPATAIAYIVLLHSILLFLEPQTKGESNKTVECTMDLCPWVRESDKDVFPTSLLQLKTSQTRRNSLFGFQCRVASHSTAQYTVL